MTIVASIDVKRLRIDLCLATCDRLDLLKEALVSLSRIEQPESTDIRIVVIDNDPAGSARDVVAAFISQTRFPVVYAIEPKKGFALARNAALAIADGDYVAFMDDDETVDPHWLKHLLGTAQRYSADVVFGPVIAVLANEAPNWIVKGKDAFFDPPRPPTGTPKIFGGAGNVLISRQILKKAGRAFNDRFNRLGGEDTEFFNYLHNIGAKMVWCNEALASETVPLQRTNFKWLFTRNFRNGQIFARVFVPQNRMVGKAKWFVKRSLGTLSGAIGGLVLWPFGAHYSMRAIFMMARNLGQLSFLTSSSHQTTRTQSSAQ